MLRLHFTLRAPLAALLVATLALGCGGSSDDDTTETTLPGTSTTNTTPGTTTGDDTTGTPVTTGDDTTTTNATPATTTVSTTDDDTTAGPTSDPDTTAGPTTDPDTTNATTDVDTTDATTTDASTTSDDTTGGVELVNGCDPLLAEDHTGDAETVVMSVGLAYAPKCIRISAGSSVKFQSNFVSHPLVGGEVVGVTEMPDPGSPIPATSMGMELVVDFPDAGAYGYYCDVHSGAGMVGAVFVE